MEVHGPGVALHLRGRQLTGRELHSRAVACRRVADVSGSLVMINDRVDVALAAGCGGVQAGARSLPVEDIRRLADGRLLIGGSVHSREEALAVVENGADFILAGTLYSTPSHPDVAPAGAARVRALAALGMPVIGIGGITATRVSEVVAAGAHGVAVIRAVWDAPNPTAAAAVLLEALDAANPGDRFRN